MSCRIAINSEGDGGEWKDFWTFDLAQASSWLPSTGRAPIRPLRAGTVRWRPTCQLSQTARVVDSASRRFTFLEKLGALTVILRALGRESRLFHGLTSENNWIDCVAFSVADVNVNLTSWKTHGTIESAKAGNGPFLLKIEFQRSAKHHSVW